MRDGYVEGDQAETLKYRSISGRVREIFLE